MIVFIYSLMWQEEARKQGKVRSSGNKFGVAETNVWGYVSSSVSLPLGLLTLLTKWIKYLYLCHFYSIILIGKTADNQVMSKPSNILFGSPQMLKWFPVTTVVVQSWSSSTTVKTSVNTKQPVIAWANTCSLCLSQAHHCTTSNLDSCSSHYGLNGKCFAWAFFIYLKNNAYSKNAVLCSMWATLSIMLLELFKIILLLCLWT